MSVSVVVPVYNTGADLDRSLPAVLALSSVDEWVWVDDGSADDSADRVRAAIRDEPRARLVLQSQNLGRGATRNRGVAETTGSTLIFLDADVVPPPHAAEALVEAIGEGVASVGRVRSVLSDPDDPYQVYLARGRRGPSSGRAGRSVSWRFFLSGVCAVRRTALDAAGGFVPDVAYGEDFALACALAELAPSGLSVADVEVELLGVGGLQQALQNAYQFGASLPAIHARHPGAYDLAGVEAAVGSRVLKRLASRPAPPAVGRVLGHLPPPLQARAVRYLLGHALLVGVHGARDPSP